MTTPRNISVCSWSLQSEDPVDLGRKMNAIGLGSLQLHLDPFNNTEAPGPAFAAQGLAVSSGMMTTIGEDYTTIESIRMTGGLRPDEHWEANLAAAHRNAALAHALGLDLVTLHAGFIPESPTDPERATFMDRLAIVADAFGQQGVRLGLETGQETADTLDAVLKELNHPSIGVNFDPANMILYGSGDPIEALERLAPHVMQAHVKDATPSATPGKWGEEVPVGTGAVDWARFFGVLDRQCPNAPLAIEREAGDDRAGDIRIAAKYIKQFATNP